ncbi:MAG: DUF362 domain-containing protein [Bacillota bacterium]|nr:DUF362 domain-containing protein [Bacillota bacterium]
MKEVYFVNLRATSKNDSLLAKLEKALQKANIKEKISEDDLTAIKLHFGELGNTTYLRPVFFRKVVEQIKNYGGKPYLTDTNTLYVGSRANAVDHLNTAIANGFGYDSVNAPLIIADGLTGKNFIEVEINKKHCKKVKLAGDIVNAQSIVAVSHFKGHMLTGFGGTLKNLAMGGASRGGKQVMHSSLLPEVTEACIGCATCQEWCPANAIEMVDDKAVIAPDICMGCGECPVSCPIRAIKIQWADTTSNVQERIAEYAYGLLKGKENKAIFINFLTDVTPDCDCVGWSDRPIVPDIGILVATDPVAIDQASVDLVNQQQGFVDSALGKNHAPGEDKFRGVHQKIDWSVQLAHGQAIGLGSRSYKLIQIG